MTEQPLPVAAPIPIDAVPRFDRAATSGLLLLFVFAALCVGAAALPDNRFIRYQQLAGTVHVRSIWPHERMWHDPTPIDIAIVGVSRTGAGIDAPALSRLLSAALGRPIRAANLAMAQSGRNAQYAVAKDLAVTHPEVRLLIAARTERETHDGHPTFRIIAERGDLLRAPVVINETWLGDIAYIPWRQVAVLVQGLVPALFDTQTRFDPARYRGTDFDTTSSYRDDRVPVPIRTASMLRAQVALRGARLPGYRRLSPALGEYEFAIERTYLRRIAAIERRNATRMAFIYLPYFGGPRTPDADPLYDLIGPTIGFGDMADDSRNFSDYGHFNRIGSQRATKRLAAILADELKRRPLR